MSSQTEGRPPETLQLGADTFIPHRVNVLRHQHELWHHVHDHWPVADDVEIEAAYSFREHDHFEALIQRGASAARVVVDGGTAYVHAYGPTPAAAAALIAHLRQEIPRADESDPDVVSVTFWTYSVHGPQSLRRDIDAPAWEDIAANYPAGGRLGELLGAWTPGVGGQLILWHGDAGTGKTSALRSLGREWRDWAELHYIVDPDKFFGDSASYMMQVMMGGGHDLKADAAGHAAQWRVLILEDCAEMLAPDARRDVGQALSRLLNACDGLIGRGLRLLILITTNEPLEKVHPAISRAGRCAARVEFPRFDMYGAQEWLRAHGVDGAGVASGHTLADLYAIKAGHRSENGKRPVGFSALAA